MMEARQAQVRTAQRKVAVASWAARFCLPGLVALAGLLFSVPLASASTVDMQAPGVSVQADEQNDSARIQVGGANITVQPGAPASPEGDTVDLVGTWKFRTDRDENGEANGWQKPEFDDTKWAILNVPGAWEEQGIKTNNPRWPAEEPEDGYNGYAWYRRHFTVPVGWANQRVTLKIGAIDDFDWTYVNGQLVGSTTGAETWDQPREYAIPLGLLKPNADNVIAIRVCDHHGGGGIVQEPVSLALEAPPAPPAPQESGAYTSTNNDIVKIGGSVTVPAHQKVEGDVVAVGGSADIYGYVTGTVVAVGGSVNARAGSRIDGDAVAVGGTINRHEQAVIGGDEVAAGPGLRWMPEWRKHVHYRGAAGGKFAAGLVIWGFIAALAVLLFRRRLEVMAEALPLHPGAAAAFGLLGFALTPAAILTMILASVLVIVLLVITIVGILAVPAVVAAMLALTLVPLALLFVGVAAVFLSLGQAVARQFGRDVITRRLGQEVSPLWAALIGVFVVCLAGLIPWLGPLVWTTVVIFGYGLAIMTGVGATTTWHSRRRHARAPHAPPPPVFPTPPAPPMPAEPLAPAEAELPEAEATQERPASEQPEEPVEPSATEELALTEEQPAAEQADEEAAPEEKTE
jgi:hypothetical protein